MLMPTVNYLRVVGWEHVAANRAMKNEGLEKATEAAIEAHEGLPR